MVTTLLATACKIAYSGEVNRTMKMDLKVKIVVLILTAVVTGQSAIAGKVKVERYAIESQMQLPFSEAVRVGNILYLSGQIGIDYRTSKLAEGGIAGETRQTLENIKTALEKHGSSMAEVVKCTVYLSDIKEWEEMNRVYVTYFPTDPPARSAVGTSGLALGARTEIECMATVQ